MLMSKATAQRRIYQTHEKQLPLAGGVRGPFGDPRGASFLLTPSILSDLLNLFPFQHPSPAASILIFSHV